MRQGSRTNWLARPAATARTRLPGHARLARRRGAVTVMFATGLVPIMMLVGLAVDFDWVLQAKAELDLAADSAAFAGAREAGSYYAAGKTGFVAAGQQAASDWWNAQVGILTNASNATATETISQSGNTFTVTVAYTANVPLVLGQLFQWSRAAGAQIANSTTATITINQFGTVDFLIDNTSSMMLAATATDEANLEAKILTWLAVPSNAASVPDGIGTTIPQCDFACHWNATASGTNQTDYYALTRTTSGNAAITLRWDVVKTATTAGIQEMVSLETVLNQLSVGVFTFGGVNMASSSYLQTVYGETTIDQGGSGKGAAAAIASLSTITPTVGIDTQINTNFGNAFNDIAALLPDSGDGSTSTSPKRALILVTDGMEDDTWPQAIPSTEGPINPAVCQVMKNKGYTVFVLYTTYASDSISLPGANWQLAPYINGTATPALVASLTACASSPSDFVQATSPTDIQTAMTTLVGQAISNATRLSN
jgi:Flp pilus assembly protein TadG